MHSFDKPKIYHICSASDRLDMSLILLITIQTGVTRRQPMFGQVRKVAANRKLPAAVVHARDAARTANR